VLSFFKKGNSVVEESSDSFVPFEGVYDSSEGSFVEKLSKFDVDPEFWLWTCEGFPVKNRKDLVSVFSKISDSGFRVHVRRGKNDFADWTEDVLGDEELAFDLRRAKDRASSLRFARKHSRKKFVRTRVLADDPVHKDFDRKEKRLLELRRRIDVEENELNGRILDLENRRSRIFADLATLERERFYYSVFWQTNNPQRNLSLKDLSVSKDVALEVVKKRLSEAKDLASGGMFDEANVLLEDSRKAIKKAKFDSDVKEYLDHMVEIVETELKIESLKDSDV